MLFAQLHGDGARIRVGTSSKYTALFNVMLRASDLAVLLLSGVIAYWLRFGTPDVSLDYQRNIVAGTLCALLVFNTSSLYQSWRGSTLSAECFRAGWLWTLALATAVLFAVALKLAGEVSRVWWATWYAGALVGLGGVRILCRGTAALVRQRGLDLRTAVVVGATKDANRIVDTLQHERWTGIRVHGWFSTPVDTARIDHTPHLGDLDMLAAYVEAHGINQVWIALPLRAEEEIKRVLDALQYSAANIKLVPDLFGIQVLNQSVGQIAGLPVINLQQSPLQGMNRLIKAVQDRVLAFAILLAISPLMLVIAAAVKLSSPGPVFYRQERVSWNNRSFHMLKFRSMPMDAETGTGAVWAKAGESRATRVGSFLRKTSLDELPQFINVLKGEMSIVGPRPERPVFVHKFKEEIPAYMKKHMVKAGITGWAQVNGWRGSTDLTRRIECDLYYIEHWSLAFDLRIILLTLFKGFVNKNAY